MKKRTLCLLLAGVMALSLLSGCGGQPAAGQPNTPDNSPVETGGNIPDNVPNNEAPMVPPDDWEETAQPEDDLPLSRDPRWDELQPGEIAMQYYDIFIKSGMTVGEVVEAVEGSKVYQEQPISWSISDTYKDFDQEFTISAPGEISNGFEILTERGWHAYCASMSIACDGENIMKIWFFTNLPGEEGTIYRVKDFPVYLVTADLVDKYANFDATRTFMGTIGEIRNLNRAGLEELFSTAFKYRDPDTVLQADDYAYRSYSFFPLSINGYSIWSHRDGEGSHEGFRTYSSFAIERGEDKLEDKWIVDGSMANVYDFYWASDDAG